MDETTDDRRQTTSEAATWGIKTQPTINEPGPLQQNSEGPWSKRTRISHWRWLMDYQHIADLRGCDMRETDVVERKLQRGAMSGTTLHLRQY